MLERKPYRYKLQCRFAARRAEKYTAVIGMDARNGKHARVNRRTRTSIMSNGFVGRPDKRRRPPL